MPGILGIIGAVLVIVTLFMPWYATTTSVDIAGSTMETTASYGLSGVTADVAGMSVTTSYAAGDLDAVGGLMSMTMIMVLIGFILMIAGGALAMMGKMAPKTVGAIVLAGGIIALLAAVLFMTGMPGALESDAPAGAFDAYDPSPATSFFGSIDMGALGTISWGGGLAWILALVAGVVGLIGGAMAMMGKKAPEETPATPPAQPPAQQPPEAPKP